MCSLGFPGPRCRDRRATRPTSWRNCLRLHHSEVGETVTLEQVRTFLMDEGSRFLKPKRNRLILYGFIAC